MIFPFRDSGTHDDMTENRSVPFKNLRYSLATAIIVSGSALVSFAQLPASTSLATQQLKNWLEAYDNPDWNVYMSFAEKHFITLPEPMLRNLPFRNMTGGFVLKTIEAEAPIQATAIIQEQDTDQIARVVVEVEPSEPHRIFKLHPEPIAPPHLNEQELIDHTRQVLERMTLADKFAGDVLIAKDGRVIFAQAYGLADREHRIPNTLHTRFGMASVGKMFTAVATLHLVKARKIKLDDAVGKYLTDYPNQEVASKVTIRELLNHTGGTGDISARSWSRMLARCTLTKITSGCLRAARPGSSQVAVSSTAIMAM